MNTIIELLLSSVFTSGAFALTVLLITRLWQNPHLARILWLLVLVKLLTPPLIKIPVPPLLVAQKPALAQPTGPGTENVQPVTANPSPTDGAVLTSNTAPGDDLLVTRTILIVWVSGFLTLALFACRRGRRVSQIINRSRAADPNVVAEAKDLARKLGLAKCPEIQITDNRIGPFVTIHRRRPIVMLPTSLLTDMSSDHRRTVLAHELAHLRRGDCWLRRFELIVLGVHWWNPIAWLASRRLRQAMETCCDAVVVWAMPESRKSYGEALLRTVEFLTESEPFRPLAGNTFGTNSFKNRINNIMKKETSHRITRPVFVLTLVIGIIALPLATMSISQEESEPSSPPDNKASTATLETPDSDKPARWEVMTFQLVDGDSDKVEQKVTKIIQQNTFAELDEICLRLRENGLPQYSRTRTSGGGAPPLTKAKVDAIKFGHVAGPFRNGGNYTIARKTINHEKIRAKRASKAERRLLQLDVKAAEILLHDAQARAKQLREITSTAAALGEANTKAQLAEITVERAKIAIDLFDLKNE